MKLIRNETESVKERLATRGVDPSEIDALIADDAKRRELLVQTEELKARRNTVSDEIGLKKRNKEDASETIAEMQAVSAKIKELDEEVAKVDVAIQDRMLHFPNLPNPTIPVGADEEANREERTWGEIPSFDFKPKAHYEIGEDLGILIGKHGQTLDAIQYLTNLVAHKEVSGHCHIVVDVENYRARREETLINLAKRLAAKVKRNRQKVSLEPMNAFERKIIHTALHDDKHIVTESAGDEPFRHIVISYKK